VKADSGFERFYEREAQAVFSAVLLLCRNRAVAEDATQEAFARAFERWDRVGTLPWAGGWVTTTAMNVARRSLRFRPAHPAALEQSSPDDALALWAAVRRLPRRQQEAVVLFYRMGVEVQEIAKIQGCEQGTVRTHLARARETLRRALEEGSHGD
jgi:RNA polymerase sigma factor (sigma-70 family)